MTPTKSSNNSTSSKLHRAEDKVTSSVASFEHAMEELAQKVEETSHRMQHVMDLANRQKDELVRLSSKAKDAVEPIMPYVDRVRRNPKPFMIGAGAIASAIALLGYFRSRRSGSRFDERMDSDYQRPAMSPEPSITQGGVL